MKRKLLLLLTALCLSLGLTACGKDNTQDKTGDNVSTESTRSTESTKSTESTEITQEQP